MKKLLIITLIILTLTACGSVSSSPQVESSTSAGSLPAATQLLVGIMKLDGMEQDVTAEQATQLLPLWQVYSELLTSDTAAQEEIDGLVKQIQATMTSEQTQAIEDMNLTQQNVMTVMQENSGGMNQASQSSDTSSSSGGFAPADGGMPMDAPPDGGAGMPTGDQSSSRGDSSQTVADQSPMSSSVPSTLVDTLVDLLKSKAGV